MTERHLIVSSFILGLVLVGSLTLMGACSDDEKQAKEAEKVVAKAEEMLAQPSATPTPEATEPAQPKTATVYYFKDTSCLCHLTEPCGDSFWLCHDNNVYSCWQNTVYQTKELEEATAIDYNCN